MNRNELIKVFEDTLEQIEKDPVLKTASDATVKATKLIKGQRVPEVEKKMKFLSNVFASDKRTFEAAADLHRNYPNAKIAVLNFASATNPGGGVRKGSSAQEECLCRASTLYPALVSKKMFKLFYGPNRDHSHNALHTDDIIYSPDVYVFKNDATYENLNLKAFKVDVITCAAPNLRENPNNQYNPDESQHIMISDDKLYKLHLNRARNILKAAVDNGVKVLVLGAFGCGAFQNDPVIVANAWHDAVTEYAGNFLEIEFAVYCGKDRYNYDVFAKKFND